ncbi:hypothetical protein PR048_017600 [Dryococelus australis]|uniref:Uncharacterized protein n=1 Tax=Dryococelus australis TaxID=614101 RepID=A0ABQ9H9Z4_9NEOP|nr:hypothetical protein PR048_017600 [Dryococelus australis]
MRPQRPRLMKRCLYLSLAGGITPHGTQRLSGTCTAAGMKGRGKSEIPEKNRRPMASSGTIPTCENPVTQPVAERLTCSLPTKVNQVRSPAGSLPDFCMWESCQTMSLVGGFSWGYPVYPTLAFHRCSIPTSITLIDSQDLAINSRQNLFTHTLLTFGPQKNNNLLDPSGNVEPHYFSITSNTLIGSGSCFICRSHNCGTRAGIAVLCESGGRGWGKIVLAHIRNMLNMPVRIV